MKLVVVYDITDDVLRNKVSERLKDYGLERIQYSCFHGNLQKHHQRSLETDMRRLLNDGEETDSVILFPLCASCFGSRRLVGSGKEMDGDEPKTMVF